MRIAIISDIHGNLEALETALQTIRKEGVDEIICLGDIVGYGASPNECIAEVQSATDYVLLGNHDEAALHPEKTEYFNPYARIAIEWTAEALDGEKRAFLETLPYTLALEGLLFVHSSPYEPEAWHYVLSPTDAQMNFSYFSEPICFVGHSHVPGIFSQDLWTREVMRGKKFIVNVGSIGQPRDNDWRLCFGIFDTEAWTYRAIRCEYDVKASAEKIRKAGLPKALAERIFVGR